MPIYLKGRIRILDKITFPTSCTISDKSSSSCKISLIYNGLCNIACFNSFMTETDIGLRFYMISDLFLHDIGLRYERVN